MFSPLLSGSLPRFYVAAGRKAAGLSLELDWGYPYIPEIYLRPAFLPCLYFSAITYSASSA